MKILSVILIVGLSFFAPNSYGQFNELDIAVEPNICKYKVKTGEPHAGGFGINLRFPMKYNLRENVSIDSRPGLSYYQLFTVITNIPEVSHFIYFSAPLYFSYCYQESISLYFGGEFEYQLGSKNSGKSILSSINRKAVYGVSGGFSYNFRGGLKFNVFYTYGLSSLAKDVKILDNNGFEAGDYLNIKKRYLTLGLSYKLYRRKKEVSFY